MAIPNGEIYLLKNIPLSSTYEHSIDFKDKNEQFNYFFGFLKKSFSDYTYIRREREYVDVGLPIAELDDVNYMIFRGNSDGRLYYAFVTDKTYANQKLTHVFFEIDVFQTYMFDYKWRASYIRQAHVDRWTADHKPIYSKTDEGLDYGTEYSVESAYKLKQNERVGWFLVTMTDIPDDLGLTITSGASELRPITNSFINVLLPFVKSGTSVGVEYSFTYGEGALKGYFGGYNEFLSCMLNSALGNYIRSISYMPYNPFIDNITIDETNKTVDLDFNSAKISISSLDIKGEESSNVLKFEGTFLCIQNTIENSYKGLLAVNDWDIGLKNSMPTAEQWAEIKANPYTTERDKRFESKLLCAPYRYNLLTDWRNDPVVYKNEYMTEDKIEIQYSFSLSYNVPFRYYIKNYKKDPEGRNTCLYQAVALEMPIISDQYYTYMLENKNTIQANLTNSIINAGTGVVSGAISGGGMGGIGGAVFGGVTGAVSGALSVQAQMRSENAKQSDLKTKPDGIICNTDSLFNILDGNTDLTFYRMRICCENEAILAEIFNISGYKVNRVEIPNTRSRTRFNYIQTMGANLIGSISQDDLRKIKEIYDNGITIWHYRAKDFNYLDYSYENIEVNLI